MKLTIESTSELLMLDGVPVRRWAGTTEDGRTCDVYVHMVGSGDLAFHALADSELKETAPPAEASVSALRDALREPILRDWLEGDFKRAVLDDDRVCMAAAMLKIGDDRGDHPIEIIRRVIADFVRELIDPGASERESRERIEGQE